MGNVSLSIDALCHAKNLPELETWFRDIIILEWEGGKLDNYVGILMIVENPSTGGKLDKYVGILRFVKKSLLCLRYLRDFICSSVSEDSSFRRVACIL